MQILSHHALRICPWLHITWPWESSHSLHTRLSVPSSSLPAMSLSASVSHSLLAQAPRIFLAGNPFTFLPKANSSFNTKLSGHLLPVRRGAPLLCSHCIIFLMCVYTSTTQFLPSQFFVFLPFCMPWKAEVCMSLYSHVPLCPCAFAQCLAYSRCVINI